MYEFQGSIPSGTKHAHFTAKRSSPLTTGKYKKKQIEKLKIEHQEIFDKMDEISLFLENNLLSEATNTALSLISKLIIYLNLHLAMEDEILYPELLDHKDIEIRSMAKMFIEEADEVNDALKYYNQKWSTPVDINNKPDEFIKETKEVFDSFLRRNIREERIFTLFEDNGSRDISE
jgi:hypothetical protein